MLALCFVLAAIALFVWVYAHDAPRNRKAISEFRARENARPHGNVKRGGR